MYKKVSEGWWRYLDFIILDELCLQISYILAFLIRHDSIFPYRYPLYRSMAILLFMTQLITTFFYGNFTDVLKRGTNKELYATIKNSCTVILFTVFCFFLTQTGKQYSRIILLLTGLFYTVFAYFTRLFWKSHLKKSGGGRNGKRSLLVITYKEAATSVLNNIYNHNHEGYKVIGFVFADINMKGEVIEGIPVVSDIENIIYYVCRKWVDEVFINLPKDLHFLKDTIDSFIEMGITVHQNLVDITAVSNQKQSVEHLGEYTVLTTSINMASSKQLFVKRVMDIAGSLIGCIIAVILFIVLSPCIYICSPGSALFSQTRVGKNGKKFKIYKFRSMYTDADKQKKELQAQNRIKDGLMFKLDHDPRIIGGEKGIGSFMRKYSLDEWPQMWNVLKGDMSLVGTRPPTLDEWEKYELHHRARMSIKPGLTGLWQVSGRSNITDFEEVVKLDKKYITDWNYALDIKILLKTIGVVIYKVGSS